MQRAMKCPFCKKKLHKGEQQRYESLCDHVSNPNMSTYPLRNTWVCDCEKSKNIFWDWYGNYYTEDFSVDRLEAIHSLSWNYRKYQKIRETKLYRKYIKIKCRIIDIYYSTKKNK